IPRVRYHAHRQGAGRACQGAQRRTHGRIFFSSRRRHTRLVSDWRDVCSSDLLQQNYALTLRRFLALQVLGSEQERELLATLRGALFSHGEADLSALQDGLEILRNCDLRSALPDIKQPALVIAGERD